MNLDYHQHLAAIATEDVRFTKERDTHYNGSWARRGGPGAFINLGRKWDRLETFMEKAGYDLFGEIQRQAGPEQGSDGTILAEVRDLRRYLLLVEAKMTQEGAVTQPQSSAEVMKKDLTEEGYTVSWHAGQSDRQRADAKRAVRSRYPIFNVGVNGKLFAPGDTALYQPLPLTPGHRVHILWLYDDGLATVYYTEGPRQGREPELVPYKHFYPVPAATPPPAAQPVPADAAGAGEEAPAVGEPGGGTLDYPYGTISAAEVEDELVTDRQPRSATELEYRAVAPMAVRRGSMVGSLWAGLYHSEPDEAGRWNMFNAYSEEYGR